MIEAQSGGAGEGGGHAVVDEKWIRCAHASDCEPVFARAPDRAEIRVPHVLIRSVRHAAIGAAPELPAVHDRAAGRVDQVEFHPGRRRRFNAAAGRRRRRLNGSVFMSR